MSVQLHPFQVETVAKMHNGCVLYGDVGVGKTITSLAYYYERVCGGTINEWGSMETPRDVVVITTAKVRDSKAFELQAAKYGVHTDPSLSTNGVKITVDSWNNLHKYVEVSDAFFIFDEQRVVGYGAWSRAFIKIARSNPWVLLSATPGDTWMDYIPVFIANGWYKHKTDFVDQHVIWTPRVKYPKVLRYQNVGVLVRRRNEVLVHMPYERHTKRHAVDIWCDYDEDLFDKAVKKRWHVFEHRPLRDVAELFIVMRKVVNSDSSRLSAVQGLLKKHPKLIVFYNFDYELEMLRGLSNYQQTSSSDPSRPEAPSANSKPSPTPESLDTTSSRSTKKHSSTSLEDSSTSSSPTGSGTSSSSTSATGELVPGWKDGSGTTTAASGTTSPSSSTELASTAESNLLLETTSNPPTSTPTSTKPGSDATTTSHLATETNADGIPNDAQKLAVAEWNGHKHEEIPKTDRWVYLVQYRAGAEGWNCIETDAICFWSQTYSYRDWWQAHGRIDRLNTPFVDLWYYHLVSRSIIDKAIRKALKVKKSFNERDLKLS